MGPEERYNINLMEPGHTGCAGCGQAIGARLVLKSAGPRVIIANATGCLEVYTTRYPQSSWEVPWIHSLFDNAAGVASGMETALKVMRRYEGMKIICQGGDGGTADIGMGCISGMWERGHEVVYVCYDNEGYMNTGYQRSGLTPLDARTTTSPPGSLSWGNRTRKKSLPDIAVAHRVPYVATAVVSEPRDLMRKVEKAMQVKGPSYLQVLVPCVPGWGIDSNMSVSVARLAMETCLFPVFEVVEGEVTSVKQVKEKDHKPVEEYLRPQKRFAHLFREGGDEQIEAVRAVADANNERYGIIKA